MFAVRRLFSKRVAQITINRFYSGGGEGRVFGSNLPDIDIPSVLIPDLLFDRFSSWDENRTALVRIYTVHR